MLFCMRTTLNLEDGLISEAKRVAQETGTTLTAVIEDALRERLARRRESARGQPVRLPTFRGEGLLPGVDLDDSASLRDLMDAAS